MRGSMVDIQSPTAEIRRGKKKEKEEETTGQKYNVRICGHYTQGGHNECLLVLISDENVFLGILWSPYGIGQTIIFSCCSLFFFFPSPKLNRRRWDVYHTSTHGVALVRI